MSHPNCCQSRVFAIHLQWTLLLGRKASNNLSSTVFICHPSSPLVVNVHLPKDRVTQTHQNYGFCEYVSEDDADYACKILNQVKLYGKPLRINKATSDKKNLDVGASLFIGNLAPDADETLLRDTFSAFGTVMGHAKVARDLETGQSKGYGFVSFDNFESSDAAIDAMNGQILANKPITVGYAYKKDGKGERHGSAAGIFFFSLLGFLGLFDIFCIVFLRFLVV